MSQYLNSRHFPSVSPEENFKLKTKLAFLRDQEASRDFFSVTGNYQRTLANPHPRKPWPEIQDKLMTLLKCGICGSGRRR